MKRLIYILFLPLLFASCSSTIENIDDNNSGNDTIPETPSKGITNLDLLNEIESSYINDVNIYHNDYLLPSDINATGTLISPKTWLFNFDGEIINIKKDDIEINYNAIKNDTLFLDNLNLTPLFPYIIYDDKYATEYKDFLNDADLNNIGVTKMFTLGNSSRQCYEFSFYFSIIKKSEPDKKYFIEFKLSKTLSYDYVDKMYENKNK